MKINKTIAFVVLQIVVLAGVGAAAIFGGATVAGPLGGAVAGGIVSIATVVASKSYEHMKEHEATIAEKRRDVYRHLMQPWARMMANVRAKKKEPTDDLDFEELYGGTFDAILYGSEEVVNRYVRLRSPGPDVTGVTFLRAMAGVLTAMREDVTKTKSQLTDEAVLSMFINFTPEQREAVRQKDHTQEQGQKKGNPRA